MNRIEESSLTGVVDYRVTPHGAWIVTCRDEAGYLRDRLVSDVRIVAGGPNLSRLERWEADGRPEIKPFPLPSNNHGGSWRRTGIPRAS